MTYLRQFKHMRMVNLAGNPLSSDPEYRSYILSHIRDLTYLDYRRVNPADVAAAMEQHQVSCCWAPLLDASSADGCYGSAA